MTLFQYQSLPFMNGAPKTPRVAARFVRLFVLALCFCGGASAFAANNAPANGLIRQDTIPTGAMRNRNGAGAANRKLPPTAGTLLAQIYISNDTRKNPIQNPNTVFAVRCYKLTNEPYGNHFLGNPINDVHVTFNQTYPNGGGKETILPMTISNLPFNEKFIVVARRVFPNDWNEPKSPYAWYARGFYFSENGDDPYPKSDFTNSTLTLKNVNQSEELYLKFYYPIH